MRKNNKGFSLVELIIVVAIMAVLVAILAPQFIKHVERSRESKDLQNIEEYKIVIESIAADKEGLDSDMQIVISGASGSFLNVSDPELQKYGLPASFELSAEWAPFTWTYSASAYSWSINNTTGSKYYTSDGQKK